MTSPYTIRFTPKAEAALQRLDRIVTKRIFNKLAQLAENVDVVSHIALTGQWSHHYKLRVGDYRLIYTFDHPNQTLWVVRVGHRSSIYDE